jgi:hypothetical protein
MARKDRDPSLPKKWSLYDVAKAVLEGLPGSTNQDTNNTIKILTEAKEVVRNPKISYLNTADAR